jgi:CTP:molybdopterin cytidylyltransferase MocA
MTVPDAAIVLAAGASVRMGQPKQLLQVGGRSLLIRTVEACLAAELWPVVVVLGAHREQLRPTLARLPVICADNLHWAEGMAGSLRIGLTTVDQFSRAVPRALITLCDQPAFSAAAVRQLQSASNAGGRGIAAARYAGRCGAPALFGRRYFGELAGLSGDQGARVLLNQRADEVAAVDLPELAVDLDTPEDWATFLRSPASP